MVYRLLGWGVVVGAYHKIYAGYKMFHVLVQNLHFIMVLVHGLTNIPTFSEVGGIRGVAQPWPSSIPTSGNKNKLK